MVKHDGVKSGQQAKSEAKGHPVVQAGSYRILHGVAGTSPGRLADPNTRVLISTGLALSERGTLQAADLPQTTERRAREWVVAAVGTLLHPARNRPGMVSTVER